jgi:CBS domain containing-hemolysin-like protein
MTLLFVYIALAISISFLCSISEAVLLSLNMTHINVIKKDSLEVGKLLEKLKKDINVSIASILVINTIANTLGAAAIGAEAADIFGMEYVFYVSAILTLLILFFSEIIPKTIGTVFYKQLAPLVAQVIRIFIFIGYPLIIVSIFLTKKISKKTSHAITREEFLETTFLVEDGGYIDEKESDLIENILGLSKTKVNEILTPRSVIFALDIDKPLNKVLKTQGIKKFSRIPVYQGSIDNIIGVVFSKKIFQAILEDDKTELKNLMVPLFSINENIPVSFALDMFIKRKEHMFLVTDSYGQTEGILTLEDCIETLLGIEIMDEMDTTEDMRKLAKDKMKNKKLLKLKEQEALRKKE